MTERWSGPPMVMWRWTCLLSSENVVPGRAGAAISARNGVVAGLRRLLLLAFLFIAPIASANPIATENVTARLVAEHDGVVPGEAIDLALVLDIRPGWHTYWKNPGDSGEPTRIHWRLPEGISAGPMRWPHPDLIRVGPLANYGYSGRASHLIRLMVPPDWPPGAQLEVTAEASWLVCEEHCIPESAELRLVLPTSSQQSPADPGVGEVFAAARDRLPKPLAASSSELGPLTGGELELAVENRGLPEGPETVWFFAGEWGLIDHAADQPWRLEDGRLLLDLTPGDAAGQVSGEGVLVIGAGGKTRAYGIDPERLTATADSAAPGAAELGLPLALGLALLGGLILNLMPCVFPVLAMKALSLTRQGGASARERALHGLAYTTGVLSFFALLAAMLLVLRAGGTAVGWGYQLQHPPFVALMACLFLVLGLSLTGAITLGSRLMGVAAAGPRAGFGGDFVTGALAALVAAPCTAPFMGAALGYALTLSWPLALSVMLTLGFGLALPYLLLSLVPGASKVLPKPGQWMEILKQFLAFPMFATAAWLVWVLSIQAGPQGVAAVLAGMILLTLGLWVWELTRQMAGQVRMLGGTFAVATLAAGVILGLSIVPLETVSAGRQDMALGGEAAVPAQPFTSERLEMALSDGRPVFVNMTAAWCITCLVNEQVTLSSSAVAEAFDAVGALYLKGDWTRRDPLITAYLERFGRSGVPLYVYYPPRGEPRVLPQILTESIVLEALELVRSDDPES